jgi:hypothetical protein
MNPRPLVPIHGEPSLVLRSDCVELALTPRCGMMAPVQFAFGEDRFQPYSLPSWTPEQYPENPPVMAVLRGDFFCLPFGASSISRFAHGETANREWSVTAASSQRATLRLECCHPSCTVEKTISLRPGERAIYQEHRISGLDGAFSYGSHAILAVPAETPGTLSSGALEFGLVAPENIDGPASSTRSALPAGVAFTSLAEVPLPPGGFVSLENWLDHDGCEDLAMIRHRDDLGWTALSCGRYVWISLKRKDAYPCTLLWFSNGGRAGKPWSGEHRRRIGIEEICSYFHLGLDASRTRPLRDRGVATVRNFAAAHPEIFRNIHLAAEVPADFGAVRSCHPAADGKSLTLCGDGGNDVIAPVDLSYLDPSKHRQSPL